MYLIFFSMRVYLFYLFLNCCTFQVNTSITTFQDGRGTELSSIENRSEKRIQFLRKNRSDEARSLILENLHLQNVHIEWLVKSLNNPTWDSDCKTLLEETNSKEVISATVRFISVFKPYAALVQEQLTLGYTGKLVLLNLQRNSLTDAAADIICAELSSNGCLQTVRSLHFLDNPIDSIFPISSRIRTAMASNLALEVVDDIPVRNLLNNSLDAINVEELSCQLVQFLPTFLEMCPNLTQLRGSVRGHFLVSDIYKHDFDLLLKVCMHLRFLFILPCFIVNFLSVC